SVRVSILIITVLALCPSTSQAQVGLDAIGVLKQYCADDEAAAPHPKKIVMRQLMTTDELATFGGTVFAGVYQAGRVPDDTGTMAVRARIERQDGSREKLNRTVANQFETGNAEVLANFPVAVREGDTVVWRIKFKNFEDMQAGDCFLLIGATMRP
ncbi:MAG: hypothetical protein OEM32_10305, partial [Acidimicrobiia bacterium]|nr:hypothetical protein [Acidimicrobiia bacterium]